MADPINVVVTETPIVSVTVTEVPAGPAEVVVVGTSGYSGLPVIPVTVIDNAQQPPVAVTVQDGPAATVGLVAVRGFSGYSGYSGQDGFIGANGVSGYSGFSGFSGDNQGSSGYSGASGYSGYSGEVGPQGEAGPTGTSGYSGYSGQDGVIGRDGVSGYSGISGYSGSGISGYSGLGLSGYSGLSAEEEMVYSKRIDFITDDELYKGEAVPGTAESAYAWRIRKINIAVDSDVTEIWADGDANFDNRWTDRLSKSYS